MNKLKVVFFGTPDFARASLEAIHTSAHEVVGVVTVADKASGRGQKVHQSPVKTYAMEHDLPLFQPEKLRNEEFLSQIQSLNADIFVVVAFRMMPKVLFSMPRLGTFNLHASLLPDYRGAAPINYAVINGETKSGVTTFFINEKIDEGNILLQAETEISPEDNAGTLHDRLMEIGAKLVVETLDGLAEGKLMEIPQNQKENPKTAYKIFKEDTKIDWEKEVKIIHNFIRGMSPYPAAFTILEVGGEQKILKIFKGKFQKIEHSKEHGEIEISKNEFKIYAKNGVYFPEELQLEGKKRMNLKDFLNGFHSFDELKLIK
jgi:methionyl-tRNA formyltransferase